MDTSMLTVCVLTRIHVLVYIHGIDTDVLQRMYLRHAELPTHVLGSEYRDTSLRKHSVWSILCSENHS